MNDDKQKVFLQYDASKISQRTTVEKHRAHPAQFLGASDLRGPRNQVYEILDNAWDECVEYSEQLKSIGISYKSKISLEIREDDSVVIADNGRGVPCGVTLTLDENGREESIPAIYKVFEREGAGGKAMGASGYSSTTAGQHGTGSAVVNSTSEYFKVRTTTAAEDANGTFEVEYYKGKRVRDLMKISELTYQNNLPVTGTIIEYKYDKEVFTNTINGSVSEVFDRDEIIERIKSALYSLTGVDIEIEFRFKDYQVVTMTPEDFSPIKSMDCEYMAEINFEGSSFKSRLYLGMDQVPHNAQSPFKTIVNRLLMRTTPTDEMVKATLSSIVGRKVNSWNINGVEYNPDFRNYFIKFCKSFHIMSLQGAQYSGQTKSDLVTDHYRREFNMALTAELKKPEMEPFIEFLAHKYVEGVVQATELERLDRKRRDELEKRKLQADEEKVNKQALLDLVDPVKKREFREKVEGKYEIAVKDCFQDKTESSLVIVEGKSVSSSLNSLAERRLPFAVCELGGKISNPYAARKHFAMLDDIKSFVHNCLSEGYKSILIMTDGDTDGLHMRMLILSIIMICRDIPGIPDYIGERRVFIINSPYSKMSIHEGCTINGNKYKAGITFISSYSETQELVNRGYGTILRKYTGLSDIVSDLDPAELVLNSEYYSQVEPPTADELEMFENLMTPSHKVKRRYTLRRVTDRAVFTYNILPMNGIRVPRERLSRFPNNDRPNLQTLDGAIFQEYSQAREYTQQDLSDLGFGDEED